MVDFFVFWFTIILYEYINNHSRKETHLYIMNIDENILSEEIKHYIEINNYAKDDKLPSERSLASFIQRIQSISQKIH